MRSILWVGAVTVALASVTLAVAQPRSQPSGREPRVPAAPKAAADAGAADNPYAVPTASASASASAAAAPTASVGLAPPPPSPLGDGGVKASPLTPEANEFPDGGSPPQSVDYDKLLGDIAALRARVASVSDNLFKSRLAISMETDGDHGKIAHLTVLLDDGIVYTAPANFNAGDPVAVYDHAVAPGRHAVTVDVERRDDSQDAFRTSQRTRFTVDVPNEQRLTLDVRIGDDSSMGGDFPSDKSGKYDLRVRAKAEATPVAK